MSKKTLFTLIAVCTMLFAFGAVSASAATYGDLTYSVSNGEVAITDCSATAAKVVIPETIDGYPVTSIGNSAFYGCGSLVSVEIPDSVTSIGNEAFYHCDSLVSVTIPDSVTSIGSEAFRYCGSLASVEIPSSVTSIGVWAFQFTILGKVNITDIEAWLKIEFANYAGNPLLNGGYLYLNGNLVTDLVIPDGITSIGSNAFYNCGSLASVTIPDSVTSIGNSAFYGCGSLVSVEIPDSVTSIGNEAFYHCDSLVSVEIPDSVTSIEELAFSGCDSLVSVEIPDSVTSIGNEAFYYCDSLVSVTFGSGMEYIPQSAFSGCSNLKYISLSEMLKYIRKDAFSGCSKIETIFYAGDSAQWGEVLIYPGNDYLSNVKVIYNAEKRTYKLETNCDVTLPDITDYAVFTAPSVKNEDLTVLGWYDNAELRGEPVSFPYYGEATTLYAAWTDRTGKSFDDALIAYANREYTVTSETNGELVYFEFVPTKTREYRFYSTGSKDTYGYLYNSNKSQLTYDDDDGDGNNFYISYNLTAGQTYYIAAKVYSGSGTFTVVIEEPVSYRINSITVNDMSGNELSSIPTGAFLATVSFTNVSAGENTVIVLAQYSASGAFRGLMYVKTKDVPTGSTVELMLPVDNKNGDIAKLKAFTWASFSDMTPMGEAAAFPAE